MDFSSKAKETRTDLTSTKMNVHVCLSQLTGSPRCKIAFSFCLFMLAALVTVDHPLTLAGLSISSSQY